MILHVEFRADGDRWRVRVEETGFARDVPNVMAYNVHGEVASFGDHPHVSGTEAARVVPIYDATRFDPAGTAGSVWYYTKLAHQEVRRGLAHVFDLFDSCALVLELPGYAEIAADLRRTFERHLYAMSLVRSYSINGRVRKLPWNLFRWR